MTSSTNINKDEILKKINDFVTQTHSTVYLHTNGVQFLSNSRQGFVDMANFSKHPYYILCCEGSSTYCHNFDMTMLVTKFVKGDLFIDGEEICIINQTELRLCGNRNSCDYNIITNYGRILSVISTSTSDGWYTTTTTYIYITDHKVWLNSHDIDMIKLMKPLSDNVEKALAYLKKECDNSKDDVILNDVTSDKHLY